MNTTIAAVITLFGYLVADIVYVLVDPRVSRRHLEIVPENGIVRFRDAGSSNGTRLNGVRVERGELALGDVLAIGDSELCVEGDEL